MRPPFILSETHPSTGLGDASVFATPYDLTAHVEAIDVENDEYVVYDSEGRLLLLSVRGREIVLEAAEEEPGHAEALHHLLEQRLLAYGEWAGVDPEWLKSASLSDLLEKIAEVGKRWANRPTVWRRLRAWMAGK